MKANAMMSLSLLLVTTSAAAAPGDITSVTVFSDRAEVTRSMSAKCDGSGRASVTFPPLPTNLDKRTLRAEATGRAKTLGVSSRRTAVNKTRDEEKKKLEDAIEAVQKKIAVIDDASRESDERSRATQGFTSYYKTVVAEAIRDPRGRADQWKKSLEFLSKDLERERLAGVDRAVTRRGLSRELAKLNRQLSRFGPSGPKEIVEATVAVSCGGENAPSVRLSYVVPHATWRPEYDLRFDAKRGDTGPGRVTLTVGAVITQSTGEDWTNAKVALSTSKPRLGSSAPLPAVLYIDGHEAGDEKILVEGAEERKSLQAGGKKQAAGPTKASLEDHGRTFTLKLPHRVTVRADGRPYWMPVDRSRGSATAKLVAVPKLSRYVYLVLAFESPASYPLIAGTAHTYRGASFVGDTRFAYTAPGEKVEVSLGIDESFRVERHDLREADQTTSFFGGTRRFERRYRTKIENRSKKKAKLEIREHIPVSKDEDIEVTLDDETTKGKKFDKERGFVTFSLTVPPRKTKSVDLAYTIALPKEWKVN